MTIGRVHIGISGWTYKPWRGTFYPKDLKQKDELSYASRAVSSIEINGTFYGLQRPSSFTKWYEQTPNGFVFSVKGSRYITHMRRLRDVEVPLANFFASGILRLNEKLGPILWQFPPSFKFDEALFDAFLTMLPRTMKAAATLAKRHDGMLAGRSWTKVEEDHRLRHAVEIRHDSFETPGFIKLLRRHNVALVVADTAGKWPRLDDVTADFVYVRLHGDEKLYESGYTDRALETWATKIEAWRNGRDAPRGKHASDVPAKPRASREVYVYFDNDIKVRAPFDASRLAVRLGVRDEPLKEGASLDEVNEQARSSWPAIARTKTLVKRTRSRTETLVKRKRR